MTAETPVRMEDRLCSVIAAAATQDPIDSGSSISRLIAIETPTPWGDDLYKADATGSIQQRVRAVQTDYFERLRAEEGWQERLARDYIGLYGIQPDREWSSPDKKRVLMATRPEGLFSQYQMAEYSFPAGSSALVDIVEAFFNRPADVVQFEEFRVEYAGFREFFVCTHGHVDVCCAKFGIPLYNRARAAYPQVRAWRMTHFGGHRFAPTAWEFPNGYKWAFLDDQASSRVLDQSGDPADLAGHVRGWSGADGHSQMLDREGLKRYGWQWLSFKRRGHILESDPEARRWRVQLKFESPSGECGTYEGVVVVRRELDNFGCGPHWGEYDSKSAEYGLESFCES